MKLRTRVEVWANDEKPILLDNHDEDEDGATLPGVTFRDEKEEIFFWVDPYEINTLIKALEMFVEDKDG